MERWTGKVAIVVGASSGIGAAIADRLVERGLIVVGFARRTELIEDRNKSTTGKLRSVKCDVTKEEDIVRGFEWTANNVGPVDVLVYSAGTLRPALFIESTGKDIQDVLNTNLFGLAVCCREAMKQMVANETAGHIVLMNSFAGHIIPFFPKPNFNIYHATKFGITATTEILRQELQYLNSKTRVSCISPGIVDTDMVNRYMGDTPHIEEMKMQAPKLRPGDVADAVVYVLGTPQGVQVHDVILKPAGEKF